ncbi:hypothetical protein Taro_035261, partial [Colocasia esculenta]|nr:hypothetical protein [Colocasia esculenta]
SDFCIQEEIPDARRSPIPPRLLLRSLLRLAGGGSINSRHLCFAQHPARGKRKRSTMEQQQTLEHRMGDWYSMPDLGLRGHWFTIPLDYGSPGGAKISVFTREVVLGMLLISTPRRSARPRPRPRSRPRPPPGDEGLAHHLHLQRRPELVDLHKDENLNVTLVGHSLGACLATLSAFDNVENGLSKVGDQPEFPVCAVVFGSPQVGDATFVARLGRLPNLRVLHVRNKIDLILQYPSGVLGYMSIGEQLVGHQEVVVPEVFEEPQRLAQPTGTPARGGGMEGEGQRQRRRMGIRAGREEEQEDMAEALNLPPGRCS